MTARQSASADVVIVGGGIIGLSIAWRLAQEGAGVTLLERGEIGGQASGAAAGMLAPLAEANAAGPFVALGLASLERYPDFVRALYDETNMDAELVGPGLLRVAANERQEQALCAAFTWQRSAGLPIEWLDGDSIRNLETEVSPTVSGGILSTAEKHVEPRRMVRALALACARQGVRIIEGAPVVAFDVQGDRVTAVRTSTDNFPADRIVVAGGAWSAMMGEWLKVRVPVKPIRGQILALACLPAPVRHTIYTHGGYLVPKADGRVIVGATEDSAGFDARPTAAGIGRLLAMAPALVPSLAGAAFESAWAGLRPASADGLPILGRLPGWENAYIAGGHYRNGILLAPITAEIMTQCVLHDSMPALAEAFGPERFTAAPVAS